MNHQRTIVVGDSADPHVEAVLAHLDPSRVAVIDASTIRDRLVSFDADHLTVETLTGEPLQFSADDGHNRGWIRRVAPAGWDHEIKIGSHRGAALAATLSTLAALTRSTGTTWLSELGTLYAAENKLVQYRHAAALGITVPDWMVALDQNSILDRLGDGFVLKPIGPGAYTDDGEYKSVVVKEANAATLDGVDLRAAPFIAQELLHADTHLRVVTVRDQAWVAALSATGVPVDWRADETAHASFESTQEWGEVAASAVRLTRALDVGYSSQDWVLTHDGEANFIDLNPSGQWLFLPPDTHGPVSEAIAAWLLGKT